LAQAWLAVLSHYPVNQRPLEISELQQTGTQRLEALHTQLIEERYEPEPAALIASPIGS